MNRLGKQFRTKFDQKNEKQQKSKTNCLIFVLALSSNFTLKLEWNSTAQNYSLFRCFGEPNITSIWNQNSWKLAGPQPHSKIISWQVQKNLGFLFRTNSCSNPCPWFNSRSSYRLRYQRVSFASITVFSSNFLSSDYFGFAVFKERYEVSDNELPYCWIVRLKTHELH